MRSPWPTRILSQITLTRNLSRISIRQPRPTKSFRFLLPSGLHPAQQGVPWLRSGTIRQQGHITSNHTIIAYRQRLKQKNGRGLLLLLLLLGACLISIRTGSLPMSDSDVFTTLFAWSGEGRFGLVIWNIACRGRLPPCLPSRSWHRRTVMQNILKNPLASPLPSVFPREPLLARLLPSSSLRRSDAESRDRDGNHRIPHLVVISAFSVPADGNFNPGPVIFTRYCPSIGYSRRGSTQRLFRSWNHAAPVFWRQCSSCSHVFWTLAIWQSRLG